MGNPNLLHSKHHFIHGNKSVTYYEIQHFLGLGFDESDTLAHMCTKSLFPSSCNIACSLLMIIWIMIILSICRF